MKHRLYAVLAVALVASLAVAQAPPKLALSATYDLSAKQLVSGATYDLVSTETTFLGIKVLKVDVLALAGTTPAAPTFGGVLATRFNVSDQTFLELGLGGRAAMGEKPHGYLFVGLGRRF